MKVPLKRLRYTVGETVINAMELAFTNMPLWLIRIIMDTIFFSLYPIMIALPSFRNTVMKDLRTSLGTELSSRRIRRIARKSMRNIFRMPGDILFYGFPKNLDRLKHDVTINGIEHLAEAFTKGNGVIGLGAHMTGFLLLTVRLANSDIPFVVPTKDPRNEMVKRKLRGWRDVSGVKYIDVDSPDSGKRQITECLAGNNLVYLIADEPKKRGGIVAPFFGRDALTAVGPAVFSLKTGAPIVPIFIAGKAGRFVIDIFPPIKGATKDEKDPVYELTCRANLAIETYIRAHPDQWVWIQRRWRM
jgi:KDO2-lipid IV(A) lauroyltransferase